MAEIYSIRATAKNPSTKNYEWFDGEFATYNLTSQTWESSGLSNEIKIFWMGDINHNEEFPIDPEEASRILQYDKNWTVPFKIPPHRIEFNLTGIEQVKLPWCMITDVVLSNGTVTKPTGLTIIEDGMLWDVSQLDGNCIIFMEDLNYYMIQPHLIFKDTITIKGTHNVLGIFDMDKKLLPYNYEIYYMANGDTKLSFPPKDKVVTAGLIALTPRVECKISPKMQIPGNNFGAVHFDVKLVGKFISPKTQMVLHELVRLNSTGSEIIIQGRSLLYVSTIIVPTWFYNVHHTYVDWVPTEKELDPTPPIEYQNYRIYMSDSGEDGASTNIWKINVAGDILPTDPSKNLIIPTNIIVAGTVDGRDVGNDGNVLDNHIANDTIHSQWYHQHVVLIGSQITTKAIDLDNTPKNVKDVIFQLEKAGEVINEIDYVVIGSTLTWDGMGLEGIIRVNDRGLIKYLI